MEDIKTPIKNKEKMDDPKTDHSKMNHAEMKNGGNPSMGIEGHDHNIMIADYKKRFFVVLILTLPIVLLSSMIQRFMVWSRRGLLQHLVQVRFSLSRTMRRQASKNRKYRWRIGNMKFQMVN